MRARLVRVIRVVLDLIVHAYILKHLILCAFDITEQPQDNYTSAHNIANIK
jgi:hypothetical protein